MFDLPNRLRVKLAGGQPVLGAALLSWSPGMVEAAAASGLDFVRIDTEHAWRRDEMIENLVRAAWLGGTVPMIRVDNADPLLVRKALEIGAGAVLVSDVRSAAQATAAVRAARFPPLGDRGFSGNCFSGGWGTHPSDRWIEWSNREPMIGIMIEHPDAVAAIEEIVAVEGLDFVFFGPGDFSIAIGLRKTDRRDPRVRAAFEATVTAARRSGLHALCNSGTDVAEMRRLVGLGIDMLELGNDLSLIAALWRNAVSGFAASPPARDE